MSCGNEEGVLGVISCSAEVKVGKSGITDLLDCRLSPHKLQRFATRRIGMELSIEIHSLSKIPAICIECTVLLVQDN